MKKSPGPDVRLSSSQIDAAVERLALRFAVQGFRNPTVAAVATTARGLLGVGLASCAAGLGVTAETLRLIEAGEVTAGDVPPKLVEAAAGFGLCF